MAKKIDIPIKIVQKLIDDLDDIIYTLGDDEGPAYYPMDVYSDEEARRITRDFFRVVERFCNELQIANHQPHLWVKEKIMADVLFGTLGWAASRFADLLDDKENKKE